MVTDVTLVVTSGLAYYDLGSATIIPLSLLGL